MEGTSEHIAPAVSAGDDDRVELAAQAISTGVSAASSSTNGDGAKKAADEASSSRPPEKERAELREITPRDPVEINLRTLLQAGVHFGHQTARWNPQMSPNIYGSRNGIHIINLPKTVSAWSEARKSIVDVVSRGGSVLFVGTKKQAQDAIVEEARRCGAYYVSRRWLGGMMTNFQTIRKSIERMNKLEEQIAEEEKNLEDGLGSRFTKKERLMMSRERDKLYFSLGGIRDMYATPQLMFVVDIRREDIAIKEAQRLDVPVVALVDTNCDPRIVTHAIPSNDDGTRAIRLFASAVADAVMEGKKIYAARGADKGDKVKTARKGARKASSKKAAEETPAKAAETPATPEEAAEPAKASEASEPAAEKSAEA